MKKLSALLLALIMLLAVAACVKQPAKNPTGTTGGAQTDDGEEYDNNGFLKDDLPSLNYNGQAFRILYPAETVNEFFCEDPGNDIVDEAVYTANRRVMDRLGITFEVTTLNGINVPADRDSYAQTVINTYSGGDDRWDVVAQHIGSMATTMVSGAFIDINTVDYIDLEKPWWLARLTEDATVNGRLYLVAGDASLSLLKNTNCLLYNKPLADDLQVEDLQELVLNGGWTKEKLLQYTRHAYMAADQANPDIATDRFGFGLLNDNHLEAFKAAFDFPILSKDNSGEFVFTYDSERAVDACEWLVSFANSDNSVYLARTSADVKAAQDAFREKRMLFVSGTFSFAIDIFNDINEDFNVIPLPKWSEDEEYSTLPRGTYFGFGIMRTTPHYDFAGAVLEAIGSEGYRHIAPEYFERALKVKYTDASENTKEIFDLIRNSVIYDFGYTFSPFFGLDGAIKQLVYANLPNWTSLINSQKDKFMTNLDDFISRVSKLEDE